MRELRLKRIPNKAPSTLGKLSEIKSLQTSGPYPALWCDRPPEAAYTVPITLLHPVFNLFLEDCEGEPSEEDHAFAYDLSQAMSGFFDDEKERRTKFSEVCATHGMVFVAAKIDGTEYITDGDMRCGYCIYCIVEEKVELGATGTEPIFQAAFYYTSNMRQRADLRKIHCTFPCLGVYLAGPMLGFMGFVYTDITQMQMLGPALRLDYHQTDLKLRRMTAQYLRAFKQTTIRLRKFYETEFPELKSSINQSKLNPQFPCYSRYAPLPLVNSGLHEGIGSPAKDVPSSEEDSSSAAKDHEIVYTAHPFLKSLVFFGMVNDDAVCVKFATSYSKMAHLTCAALGFAPQLLGFEELPGGWYMLVMDRIDNEYIPMDETYEAGVSLYDGLQDLISEALSGLHQAGYVHGDLRPANVMVRRDGKEGLKFIDFDWSGVEGKVCYPMNVNRRDLWRPKGVVDEAPILTTHDIAMVKHMFEGKQRIHGVGRM
ncbi:hypothetical protein BD410DRAFT_770441 [Rickenella mellea]|uniref:Uncharacterized protein n=1 Tax=Rickenella mellea TaxID=50990 RepID=A0A4Y7Q4Z1_9AGAM|nr:hypothetical protein BD410DRAFT_770441 [Rickenella mellea]